MSDYCIYPTLLDNWSAYKRYDSVTEDELLARINRVSTRSFAAIRGEAFNSLIDNMAHGLVPELTTDERTGRFRYKSVSKDGNIFTFDVEVCDRLANMYRESVQQVFLEGDLMTRYGKVHLYGYADGIFPTSIHDIKTTERYEAGKYRHGWQAYVYTYCMRQMGGVVDGFMYDITDFTDVYQEYYSGRAIELTERVSEIEEFIEYIEAKRDLITAPRLFGKWKR